jgi:hypothetical protein
VDCGGCGEHEGCNNNHHCVVVTWVDPGTGYEWQVDPVDPPDKYFDWQEAIDYCKGLDLGGHQDWHLPTISELRTLVRGCPATQTGDSCGVTDDCLEDSCRDDSCDGCAYLKGPGPDGVYGPARLNWSDESYWSLSSVAGDNSLAWYVYFDNGILAPNPWYIKLVDIGCSCKKRVHIFT